MFEDEDRPVAAKRHYGAAQNLLLSPLHVDLDEPGSVARLEHVVKHLELYLDVLDVRLLSGGEWAIAQPAPPLGATTDVGELRDPGMVREGGLPHLDGGE